MAVAPHLTSALGAGRGDGSRMKREVGVRRKGAGYESGVKEEGRASSREACKSHKLASPNISQVCVCE